MKKYVLALAILALPGLAFGQYGTMTVATPGQATPVVGGVIEFDPAVDVSIKFDVYFAAPPGMPLDGGQFSILSDLNPGGTGYLGQTSGDNDWAYDPVAPYTHANLYGPADYFTGVGFGAFNGAPLSAVYGAGQAESYMTFAAAPVPGPIPGVILATYELIPNIPLTVGDSYLISADNDPPGMFLANGWTAMLDPAMMGTWNTVIPLQVDIVPEPASVLLLLGALPFLRRRR